MGKITVSWSRDRAFQNLAVGQKGSTHCFIHNHLLFHKSKQWRSKIDKISSSRRSTKKAGVWIWCPVWGIHFLLDQFDWHECKHSSHWSEPKLKQTKNNIKMCSLFSLGKSWEHNRKITFWMYWTLLSVGLIYRKLPFQKFAVTQSCSLCVCMYCTAGAGYERLVKFWLYFILEILYF